MYKAMVRFDTVVDAKKFVNLCNSVPFDVDLVSGRYVIDGKSIMGIFSLDLTQPIDVEIHSDDCDAFVDEIKPYIV